MVKLIIKYKLSKKISKGILIQITYFLVIIYLIISEEKIMKSWGRRVKQILNSLTQDLAGRLSYYYLYYPNHFLFPLLWLLSRHQEGISTFLSSTRINTLGSKHRLFSNKSFLKLMCICTLETVQKQLPSLIKSDLMQLLLLKMYYILMVTLLLFMWL